MALGSTEALVPKRRRFWGKSDKTAKGKLLYLESIRGLAALAVLFSHAFIAFFPYPISAPEALSSGNDTIGHLFYGLPLGFITAGMFAVVLFFVLSGYVLTYRFFKTNDTDELKKQAAKRYPRLAIPVFCVVILAYMMIAFGLFGYTDDLFKITGSYAAAGAFAINADFFSALYSATIGVFANADANYNVVLWTMPIELIGSFIIFGLAALFGRAKKRWIFYIGAIILTSQTYFVCFIIGMLLADLENNTKFIEWSKRVMNKFYSVAVLAIVVIIASTPLPGDYAPDRLTTIFNIDVLDPQTSIRLLQYLGAFLLLWLIISVGWLQRALSWRPLVFLGGLSFPFYLLHFIVLYSFGAWLFVTLWNAGLGLEWSALLSTLSVLVATLLISVVWKKYIDDMSVSVSRSMAGILLK